MRREASRVSFLMCPFCVRPLMPSTTTQVMPLGHSSSGERTLVHGSIRTLRLPWLAYFM